MGNNARGKFKLVQHGPYFQKTLLGWIIVGKVTIGKIDAPHTCLLSIQVGKYDLLNNQMEAFWKLVEVMSEQIFTKEEKLYKDYYEKYSYVSRDNEDRFIVKFPFKENYR